MNERWLKSGTGIRIREEFLPCMVIRYYEKIGDSFIVKNKG
jgi:hypothetical protein